MDAVQEAGRVLELTGQVGRDGAPRVPVDPARVADRLGIRVYEARLNPGVSGALVKESGRDPVIVLSDTDHRHRKRFTCAHEIGHFVQREASDGRYAYVDHRDELSGHTDGNERFANAFGAALLMPASEVRRYLRTGASDGELALIFDVSPEAMLRRLQSLGLR